MFQRLLTWLKNRFTKKPPEQQLSNSCFDAREQEIYTYWNGITWIKADPMVLFKKVMDVSAELSIDIAVSQSPSKNASQAHNKVVDKVRGIFSIKPFEEGGLTEIKTAQLLDHFMTYIGIEKKSTKTIATSVTAASEPIEPTLAANLPTPNTSASGLTANEPSTEPPPPLPTERELPWEA